MTGALLAIEKVIEQARELEREAIAQVRGVLAVVDRMPDYLTLDAAPEIEKAREWIDRIEQRIAKLDSKDWRSL